MKYLISIIGFCVSLLTTQISQSQWTQTNGPTGNNINCFASNEEVIYAGTGDGIYGSIDSGSSWGYYGMGGSEVISVAANATSVFASTYDILYRSTNSGPWTEISNGLPDDYVKDIEMGNNEVYAATGSNGVFFSVDNGDSWTLASTGMPNQFLSAIASVGSTLYAAFGPHGLYTTTNNGTNWSYLGLQGDWIQLLEVRDTNFLIVKTLPGNDSEYDVLISTDNGQNWIARKNGLTDDVYCFAFKGQYIFAGGYDGVYRTANEGVNWMYSSIGIEGYRISRIHVYSSRILAGLMGSNTGIYVSDNDGQSWELSSYGILPTSVSRLKTSGSDLFAGTYYYGGIRRTSNSGENWLSTGFPGTDIHCLAATSTDLYASTTYDHSVIYHSSDNGQSWAAISSFPNVFAISAIECGNGKVYTSTQNFFLSSGLHMTTDNGANWTRIGSYSGATCLYSRGNDLFVGGYYYGVHMTTNDGVNWINLNNGLPLNGVTCITSKDNFVIAGFSGNGTYVTTNNGQNWTAANNGLSELNVTCLEVYGQYVFAGTNSGVFVSTNVGASWREFNGGLEFRQINALEVNGIYLFAGTVSGGVWRLSLETPLPIELLQFAAVAGPGKVTLSWSTSSEVNNFGFEIEKKAHESNVWSTIGFVKGSGTTGIVSNYAFEDRNIMTGTYDYRLKQIDYNGNYQYFYLKDEMVIGAPDKFSLHQNFPNPFNPVTKIGYDLARDGNVRLVIYDMSGREVKTIVNEFKPAGYYTATLDAGGLSSGVYFCKLIATPNDGSAEFIAVRKLLRVK